MNASKMIKLCKSATKQLDNLEALLAHLPPEMGAHAFVYMALADVKELHHVAKRETANRVTAEQALHIQQILQGIHRLMRMMPDGAEKELGGET